MIVKHLRPALLMFVALTVITGGLYPAVVTALAQALFPAEANGSLIVRNGAVAGSSLIGQPFDDPTYFWSRPSATPVHPYNAAASSGSNFGPLHPELQASVRRRAEALRLADPSNVRPIPVDLVTASGSGLDPHISVAAAQYQFPRVAAARGMTVAEVSALVDRHTSGRPLGFLGEPTVNVLTLNLALDDLTARKEQ